MKYNNNKEYSLEISYNNYKLTNISNSKNMQKFVHQRLSSSSHNKGEVLIFPYCKCKGNTLFGVITSFNTCPLQCKNRSGWNQPNDY